MLSINIYSVAGHECSLNFAHWCMPFTTKDLCRISQTLYRLLRQQLLAAVFDHLPLRTMSCRVHFPGSASGHSRMQVPLRCLEPPSRSHSSPCSPHLQSLKFSSRVSTLTRNIYIAIPSVRPSVYLSVRNVPVLDENGLTYFHIFFTMR